MSEQVTIHISEHVAQRAAQVASRNNRRIEDVLSEWLDQAATELPVDDLPDSEVLALTELRLTPEEQAELSDLLVYNREGTLDAEGRRRLDNLMRVYEQKLLRKAQALRVAVERGLREPLQS